MSKYIFLAANKPEDLEKITSDLKSGITGGYTVVPTSLWEEISPIDRVFAMNVICGGTLTLKD